MRPEKIGNQHYILNQNRNKLNTDMIIYFKTKTENII